MGTNQQRREAAKRKLDRQLARRAERAKRRKIIGIGVAAGVVIIAAGLVVVITGDDEPEGAATAQGEQGGPESCEYQPGGEAAKQVDPPSETEPPREGTVGAQIDSSAGPIDLTLDREQAPCAVNSFISLAEQNYFDDTTCHRISTEGLQMLQCGDPTGTGQGGPGYSFADEVDQNTTYPRGTLAMANSGPNTNGSQFFLVFGDAQLPPQYTAFGRIGEEGLQTIDQIAEAGHDGSLDPSPGGGAPNEEVRFREVTVDA
ncbi:peptidylprolyl isomerase [Saccharomonospora sp. CUA-673]|uniref:peptidylprolyl isomerase n=1 Tax=Saccharomonospora sp. CUA-673 TaxID=1904969 RepID=UPI0009651E5C|nr:peptidylprolyl isomerase [Saccharomonospora sp. CUA-673]OLT42457.1 peptidylprolyl isomerase [Saccharomonospora sp. CUA-673]